MVSTLNFQQVYGVLPVTTNNDASVLVASHAIACHGPLVSAAPDCWRCGAHCTGGENISIATAAAAVLSNTATVPLTRAFRLPLTLNTSVAIGCLDGAAFPSNVVLVTSH